MSIEGIIGLALATMIFAAIPGPGVMALMAQAVGRGFKPAIMWTTGLVIGDFVYLVMAMLGMGWVASQLGDAFVILKWAGAAYLIYLGIKCWRAPAPVDNVQAPTAKSLGKSVVGGACVSLGNPKVIAFYCGFLPGFIDLQHMTTTDMLTVVCVIIPTVFTVLAVYAWLAARGGKAMRSTRAWKIASRTAGSVMIGTGIAVATD